MLDVTLTLAALVAGGISLELFATALPEWVYPQAEKPAADVEDEFACGNPS